MRRNLWIRAVWLAAAGAVVASRQPPAARAAEARFAPASPAGVAVPSTATERAALLAGETPPADREEAARRLVAGGTPADAAAVAAGLRAGGTPAQVAARAVAAAADPDPAWVDPLAALLGPNRAVTDAAAAGLAAYGDAPSGDRALSALVRFADGTAPPLARAPALTSMAAFVSPAAAGYLVNAVRTGNATIQRAAAGALAELSGEADRGSNPALWDRWWQGHRSDLPAVWLAYVRGVRARGATAARLADQQLAAQADRVLEDVYHRVPNPAARGPLLLEFMQSPAAPIRATGARLATSEVANGVLPNAVLQRVRVLVSDDDPAVRSAALAVVQTAVDPQAGPYLVAQLGRERDPALKLKLAFVLGKLQDLDAVPALAEVLHDPRPAVAAGAAGAIGRLGPLLRQQRPAAADRVGAVLNGMVNPPAGAGPSAPVEVRVACLAALAALGDPQAFATFRALLGGPEPWELKVAALNGFGTLGDPRADAIVANSLQDDDPKVQLAAALALQTVGTVEQLEQLDGMLNNQQEEDDVRQAAWQAMARRFETAPADLLQTWVGRFRDDPERRLTVQQDYGRALAQKQDPGDVAANDQEVAATLMDLKRPADAVAALQPAVDYYAGQPQSIPDALVGQMLDAHLAAKQYRRAADFAAQQLRRPDGRSQFMPLVGSKFLDEVDRLRAAGDADDANAVIDAASVMQPPLEGRYATQLKAAHTPPVP